MLASERSLTAAHQSHSQNQTQRRQQSGEQSLSRSRNGAAKLGIRPVKIYVIDPRKLPQRLEAYVDQKNQKQAADKQDNVVAENPKVDECRPNCSENAKEKLIALTSNKNSIASSKAVSKPVSKVLPVLAPKLAAISTANTRPVTGSQELGNNQLPVLGNSAVTLQCINTVGYRLPVVVTNGVALLQSPISQSTIQANGIFLSGVATSVITNGATIIGSSAKTKSKPARAPKRKIKKRKVAKKKKPNEDDKEKEEEDRELTYLRKETTTRTGRISRPITQPHSPPFSSLHIPTSSPFLHPILPNATAIASYESTFGCRTCCKVYKSFTKLNSHYKEFPQHNTTQDQSQLFHYSTNDQGNVASVPQSGLTTNMKPVPSKTTALSAFDNNPVPKTLNTGIAVTLDPEAVLTKNLGLGQLNSPNQSLKTFMSYTTTTSDHQLNPSTINDFFSNSRNKSFTRSCASEVNSTSLSLVPDTATEELFLHRISQNVDEVPTSYSIPSSPPSQCQSPGLPDDDTFMRNIPDKEVTFDTRRICNSPIDPMLLRSRSPFPPAIVETSIQSVSVSNLSIPEESLCKGELFMDLGDGVLENLENASDTNKGSPFSNENDSAVGPLFSQSPLNDAAIPGSSVETEHQPLEVNLGTSNQTSPHITTPILLETTEDANDGENFQTAKYTGHFVHPSTTVTPTTILHGPEKHGVPSSSNSNRIEQPKTPQSVSCVESDVSMDGCDNIGDINNSNKHKTVWQVVKEQIKHHGINQICGEISEMAERLSRLARDQFIPIREEEIERLGNAAPIIQVDTPFFSHLLDLPFGTYVFKEDAGRRKKLTPPPPMTTSEFSFTGGVEDVENFLAPDIDLISLPHLTNLDLS